MERCPEKSTQITVFFVVIVTSHNLNEVFIFRKDFHLKNWIFPCVDYRGT